MIESEIASCPDCPWLRKISLRDRQHDASVPQKPDRIDAVLFTLCDANMAKCLTITIAKHWARLQNTRLKPAAPTTKWNHHANPEPRR
ncbi:hypothetical protein [Mesorhizobium sp. dw_380]|uniref:hypothetical protein n=1 Tax=Mesorhizobium sp. dw_380 TaxID=2812001 RepID=UPI001BDF1D9A|nr:hypothetical protein [Mesorhizobium sp. dw_380]